MKVLEVASELRVSPQTIYRRIGAGELEAVQLGSGPKAPIRVRAGAVERFLASHSSTEPA
jgi:excisionase family DNA binding protein